MIPTDALFMTELRPLIPDVEHDEFAMVPAVLDVLTIATLLSNLRRVEGNSAVRLREINNLG